MTLTSKDHRFHRRYNPIGRQLMSIFLLVIVFPALTGLDVVAYDAVNELNGKRAQEKYTHDQLCEIASQHLHGNLIPRLRILAQKVKDAKAFPGGDHHLKPQINELSDDLNRFKLALLANFSKQKSTIGSVAGDSKKSKISHLKSKILPIVNHLTTHCKDLASSNKDKRDQAAAKILKLTDPQNQVPAFKLPTAPRPKSKADFSAPQLNSLPPPSIWKPAPNGGDGILASDPNGGGAVPSGDNPESNNQQPNSDSNKSKIINHKSKIDGRSTILDLSLIPYPSVQVAAATDVLTTLLTEITDPDSRSAPTAADIVVTSPHLVRNEVVTELADDLKTRSRSSSISVIISCTNPILARSRVQRRPSMTGQVMTWIWPRRL